MIDKKTILHIAKLAHLEIKETEVAEFSDQLSKVFGYFEQIAKIDTKNIEPLITPTDVEAYYRPDEVVQILTAEEMVANAPERTGNLFKVPPVVG